MKAKKNVLSWAGKSKDVLGYDFDKTTDNNLSAMRDLKG